MELTINWPQQLITINEASSGFEIRNIVCKCGLIPIEFYLIYNGKLLRDEDNVPNGKVQIVLKALGGKGGFGSMLRAIGAQIEKTTNREACRDLSGRRLRDINEEQRLKNWIAQQAEREKEAKDRRQKKLEKLCEQPKHEFKDDYYDKERSELPEKVEDAVLKGLEASCSTKRKCDDKAEVIKKKKAKLWVDDELDEDLSSSDDESEENYEDKTKLQSSSPQRHLQISENENLQEDESVLKGCNTSLNEVNGTNSTHELGSGLKHASSRKIEATKADDR